MELKRIGAWYEVLGEQASQAAALLGRTVGKRRLGNGDTVKTCAVPYHELDRAITILSAAGVDVTVKE